MTKTSIQTAKTASVADNVVFRGGGQVTIHAHAHIQSHVILDTGGRSGRISIGSRAKIKTGCIINAYGNNVDIQHRVTIGEYSIISGHGGVYIGMYSMIAPYVMINAASHITDGEEPFRFQGETAKGVHISENVWLGVRSSVLDGVSIGKGSIIGAHSLVRENIAAGLVAFGTPAKPRRMTAKRRITP